jgi:hypothetical protein
VRTRRSCAKHATLSAIYGCLSPGPPTLESRPPHRGREPLCPVGMKIGRSCSLGLIPFACAHCIPARFTSPPLFSGVARLRCSTPTARRVALSPSAAPARSSHHAPHRVRRCVLSKCLTLSDSLARRIRGSGSPLLAVRYLRTLKRRSLGPLRPRPTARFAPPALKMGAVSCDDFPDGGRFPVGGGTKASRIRDQRSDSRPVPCLAGLSTMVLQPLPMLIISQTLY